MLINNVNNVNNWFLKNEMVYWESYTSNTGDIWPMLLSSREAFCWKDYGRPGRARHNTIQKRSSRDLEGMIHKDSLKGLRKSWKFV